MSEEEHGSVHAIAERQRIAAIEMLPPVHAATANEFSRLLQRQSQAQSNGERKRDDGERANSWERARKNTPGFAKHMLTPEDPRNGGMSGRDAGAQRKSPSAQADQAELPAVDAGAARSSRARARFAHFGASLFGDSGITDLAHELADCVHHADLFGASWQLEMLLSSKYLLATRLILRCDHAELNLRFVCADSDSRIILENNRTRLLTSLGAISMRPVVMSIEEDPREPGLLSSTRGCA